MAATIIFEASGGPPCSFEMRSHRRAAGTGRALNRHPAFQMNPRGGTFYGVRLDVLFSCGVASLVSVRKSPALMKTAVWLFFTLNSSFGEVKP